MEVRVGSPRWHLHPASGALNEGYQIEYGRVRKGGRDLGSPPWGEQSREGSGRRDIRSEHRRDLSRLPQQVYSRWRAPREGKAGWSSDAVSVAWVEI